ncbi:ABC transporter ATP-binding protein [Fretibacter rubidus]|uniref:ABC transporter ATP-binding protein n=1 Tax=Fretibacter rubidus TaxID=570162 RepID=UPI00352B7391
MANAPLISCQNLTKIYKMGQSEVRALDGVSLDIADGEFVAIIGSSGSGKSTLMNMLGALDQPTSGTVMINGENIGAMSGKKLATFRNKTIGFIFQQFQLLPKKSALKNVALPLQYRRPKVANMSAKAAHCLDLVGLGDRGGHRPTELSGGQQQRVAIARALAGDPKVLLADEPTGALDSKTSTSIMTLMQELNAQGITIIVITHEDEVAAYAKRVIEFRDGKILSDIRKDTATHTAKVGA